MTELIRGGSQGKVYMAVRRSDNKVFALKRVKLDKSRPSVRESIINEASLLSYFDSQYLVKCWELYEYDGHMHMIIDYMDFGSQESIIKHH